MPPARPRAEKRRHASIAFAGTFLIASLLSASAATAQAKGAFIQSGVSIHPACVQALAMSPGDRVPVLRALSLSGCMASERANAETFRDGDRYGIEIDGGKFMYNHLSTLDNGLFIVGITRVLPDGSERFSLAAFQIAERPTLVAREVMPRRILESIGEVWLNDMQRASLRTSGNRVSYSAGVAGSRVEETIDLSRIGKASR